MSAPRRNVVPALRFYLGTHCQSWLGDARFAGMPLFVSRRRLEPMRVLPRAVTEWSLDSGGFTELSLHGRWALGAREYVAVVRRLRDEIGGMRWAAPQDWMCEPQVTAKTGLSVREHVARTVANYLELRAIDPELPIIPVVQGFVEADYLACVGAYDAAGIDLRREPVVGVGTICRRQGTAEAEAIIRRLRAEGLRIHAFGAKTTGLRRYSDALVSADSLAWSFDARRAPPLPGCTHKNCANCARYALGWHAKVLWQYS